MANDLPNPTRPAAPSEAEEWMQRAIHALQAGATAPALEYLDRCLALAPENAQAWFRKGLVLLQVERYDEAAACYERALAIDSAYAKVWFNLGLIRLIQKRPADALPAFERALALSPGDTKFLYHKGAAHRDLQEWDRAVECFDKVLALDPAHSDAWDGKAGTLSSLGREEDALKCYREFVRLRPGNAGGWYNVGVSQQTLGRATEALASYDRTLSLDPNYALAWNNKGGLLSEAGRFKEAAHCFQRAIAGGCVQAADGLARCKERLTESAGTQTAVPRREYGPGDVIPPCLAVHGVARGGMGVVYLCHDSFRKQAAAVKTFQDRYLNSEPARKRFLDEALLWVRLKKHPHVVECQGAFTVDGRPHVLLEYVQGAKQIGTSLRDWLVKGKVDTASALKFAVQCCSGMLYAQETVPGFLHCDLKPENILITEDGVAKLTDFGLARSVDGEEAAKGPFGTPPYVSPEQAQGRPLDVRSDVYSFGCVLYEMFTGRMVFRAATAEEFFRCHVAAKPVPLRQLAPDLPPEIDAIVMRCLEKNPARRPAGFGEILTVLRAVYERGTGRRAVVPAVPHSGSHEEFNRVAALHNLGRTEEALALLSGIDPGPKPAATYYLRATMLYELRRLEEALSDFDKVLASEPEDADIVVVAWIGRGNCLDHLGRPEEALRAYDRALELDPSSHEAKLERAVSLAGMGQREQALRDVEAYLQVDPWDCGYLRAKADFLLRLGRPGDAIPCYDRVLQVDPMETGAWNDKGVALFGLQRWAEALVCFERLTTIAPTDAKAWYNRGSALRNLGRLPEALACYDRTLELDPYYPDVKAARAEVVRLLGQKR